MSAAAVAHYQPERLDLLPAAEVQLDMAAGPDRTVLHIACAGPVRDAEVRISTDGRPHLVVAVLQPTGALPVVATFHGAVAHLWHLQAMERRLLRPGAVALLRGAGLRVKPHAGMPALHLVECLSVSELDLTDPIPSSTTEAPHASL